MHRPLTSRWKQLALGFALVGALLVGLFGATRANTEALPPASTAVVVRDVLIQATPAAAPDQVLQLVRYDIPAGVVLPEHTHPGVQAAYIESGVLTYHVISGGTIAITRADGTTEELGPGANTELYPGDAAVEVDGVVHYGENLGTEPVIILASTLLAADQPPSVVVAPDASPADPAAIFTPIASPAN